MQRLAVSPHRVFAESFLSPPPPSVRGPRRCRGLAGAGSGPTGSLQLSGRPRSIRRQLPGAAQPAERYPRRPPRAPRTRHSLHRARSPGWLGEHPAAVRPDRMGECPIRRLLPHGREHPQRTERVCLVIVRGTVVRAEHDLQGRGLLLPHPTGHSGVRQCRVPVRRRSRCAAVDASARAGGPDPRNGTPTGLPAVTNWLTGQGYVRHREDVEGTN
jgi:hypothetical protein